VLGKLSSGLQEIYVAKNKPKVIINTFSDEEVSRLLKVEGDTPFLTVRNRAMLAMLFDIGMRRTELCNLVNDDIKEMYISIVEGKGKKERHVGKSPLLEKYLIRYERIKNTISEIKLRWRLLLFITNCHRH
jgi:integrase/recombinase XerD